MDSLEMRQGQSAVTLLRTWLRRHGLAWVEARLTEAREKEIDAEERRIQNEGE